MAAIILHFDSVAFVQENHELPQQQEAEGWEQEFVYFWRDLGRLGLEETRKAAIKQTNQRCKKTPKLAAQYGFSKYYLQKKFITEKLDELEKN